ncbi:MAG: hypothetical protein AB1606_05540 [Nitrospirota bacterium]
MANKKEQATRRENMHMTSSINEGADKISESLIVALGQNSAVKK